MFVLWSLGMTDSAEMERSFYVCLKMDQSKWDDKRK